LPAPRLTDYVAPAALRGLEHMGSAATVIAQAGAKAVLSMTNYRPDKVVISPALGIAWEITSSDGHVRAVGVDDACYLETDLEHDRASLRHILAELEFRGFEPIPEEEEMPEILEGLVTRIHFYNVRSVHGVRVQGT
jgi:hypothetical protein